MHRVNVTSFMALLLAAGALSACADPAAVVVEVLPPRTSVTCAAASATDPALGRGLLDVAAVDDGPGGYVGDVRVSAKGRDVRVTGMTLSYAYDGDALGDALDDAAGAVALGDVVLSGEDDELRVAVLENVPLVPRALAVAIHDGDADVTQTEFARIDIELAPEIDGEVQADTSSFSVDVCVGCLVEPPPGCDGTGENTFVATVCRPGQDVASFKCIAAGSDE
jgi:hypothetical protein